MRCPSSLQPGGNHDGALAPSLDGFGALLWNRLVGGAPRMTFSSPSRISVRTSGNGWWTNVSRLLEIRDVTLVISRPAADGESDLLQEIESFMAVDEKADADCMEIRCGFTAHSWSVAQDGFVYSDPGFLVGLRSFFEMNHYRDAHELRYTTRARQGDDYVSLRPGTVALMREVWSRRSGKCSLHGGEGSQDQRVICRMAFDVIPEAPIEIFADRDLYKCP